MASTARKGQPVQPGISEPAEDVRKRKSADAFIKGSAAELPRVSDEGVLQQLEQQPTEFSSALKTAEGGKEKATWKADAKAAETLEGHATGAPGKASMDAADAAASRKEKPAKQRSKRVWKPNPEILRFALKYQSHFITPVDEHPSMLTVEASNPLWGIASTVPYRWPSSMVDALPSLGQLEGETKAVTTAATSALGRASKGLSGIHNLTQTWRRATSNLEVVPATAPLAHVGPLASASLAVLVSGATNLANAVTGTYFPALQKTYLSSASFARKAGPVLMDGVHSAESRASLLFHDGKEALVHNLGGSLRKHGDDDGSGSNAASFIGSRSWGRAVPMHGRRRSRSFSPSVAKSMGIVSISNSGQEIADAMRYDEAEQHHTEQASSLKLRRDLRPVELLPQQQGQTGVGMIFKPWDSVPHRDVPITAQEAHATAAISSSSHIWKISDDAPHSEAQVLPPPPPPPAIASRDSDLDASGASTSKIVPVSTEVPPVRALSSATPGLASLMSGAVASSPFEKPL